MKTRLAKLHRLLRCCGLAGAFLSQAAGAQRAAPDAEQQSIELTVARYLVPDPAKSGLAGYGLDPLAYVLALPSDGRAFVLSGDTTPSLLKSHAADHLAELAKVLGLEGLASDTKSCSDPPPASCRIGPFRGLVAFARASVSGATARIVVTRWGVAARPQGGVSLMAWYFTLEKSDGVWRVVSVKGAIS
jgi:hypothetical protein